MTKIFRGAFFVAVTDRGAPHQHKVAALRRQLT
jgi:hypothetical protein